MKPIRLEVIAPTLEGMRICTACEAVLAEAGVSQSQTERALDEYPAEWQADVRRLSDLVYALAARYGARIQIRVIDAQSPAGLVKSLRYRVRRYPTWIVNGRARIVGWDRAPIEAAIEAAGSEVTARA